MPEANEGQQYEEMIRELLRERELLPDNLKGNDAGFIHRGVDYYLGIKNNVAPDFGQKGLVWTQTAGWKWREQDVVTELYDDMNVIDYIDKTFIPRRHSKPNDQITLQDKRFDQQHFEKSGIEIDDPTCLYEFYARKECYYIQVERRGFYYLKHDPAHLKVPQFVPKLTLRLRAKTHHSDPVHQYGFFAVIQA